jgi:hypothetical protein
MQYCGGNVFQATVVLLQTLPDVILPILTAIAITFCGVTVIACLMGMISCLLNNGSLFCYHSLPVPRLLYMVDQPHEKQSG